MYILVVVWHCQPLPKKGKVWGQKHIEIAKPLRILQPQKWHMNSRAHPFHLTSIPHESTMASKVIEAAQNSALKAVHKQVELVIKRWSKLLFERTSPHPIHIKTTIYIFTFITHAQVYYVLATSAFLLYQSYLHLTSDPSS